MFAQIDAANDFGGINSFVHAFTDGRDVDPKSSYGFITELINSDCDIITGYNMFFFDEKYIFDRCKDILKIDISFMSSFNFENSFFGMMYGISNF